MSSDWDGDEEVGYRRPPSWTRFRKGHSGNPKGRPPKERKSTVAVSDSEADRQLRRALDRKIRVTDAKGTRTITASDAVALSQVTKAVQGNVPAQRDVRKAQLELEAREQERARVEAEAKQVAQERKFKFLRDLKADQALAWDEARSAGYEEPECPWPHPDDIALDYSDLSVRVRGPLDPADLPRFVYLRAERDSHFSQTILCLRSRDRAARHKAKFHARLLAIYDVQLPLRWQICDHFMEVAGWWLAMPLTFVKEDVKRAKRNAEILKPLELRTPIHNCESYPMLNKLMKPILKAQGLRSLAELERAWGDEFNGSSQHPSLRGWR